MKISGITPSTRHNQLHGPIPKLAKGAPVWIANDHLVQNLDFQKLSRADQVTSNFDIRLRWRRLAARVSSDPDDDALAYLWFNEPEPLPFASGVTAANCPELGPHTIRLVVTDPHGASGTNAFTLEVAAPSEVIEVLLATVDHASLERRNKRPLIATLKVASASFDGGDLIPGINQLQAFQNKVRTQFAPSDPALAQQLIDTARAILDALSTP